MVPTRLPQTLSVEIQWFQGEFDDPPEEPGSPSNPDHDQERHDACRNQRDRQDEKADPAELIGLAEVLAFEVDHTS